MDEFRTRWAVRVSEPIHGVPESCRHSAQDWIIRANRRICLECTPAHGSPLQTTGWERDTPGAWYASCCNQVCKTLHKGLRSGSYRCPTCQTHYVRPVPMAANFVIAGDPITCEMRCELMFHMSGGRHRTECPHYLESCTCGRGNREGWHAVGCRVALTTPAPEAKPASPSAVDVCGDVSRMLVKTCELP